MGPGAPVCTAPRGGGRLPGRPRRRAGQGWPGRGRGRGCWSQLLFPLCILQEEVAATSSGGRWWWVEGGRECAGPPHLLSLRLHHPYPPPPAPSSGKPPSAPGTTSSKWVMEFKGSGDCTEAQDSSSLGKPAPSQPPPSHRPALWAATQRGLGSNV